MGNITETSVFENMAAEKNTTFGNGLNETIYASSYLIGVDEVKTPPLRNITLLALLNECGCLTSNDGTPFPQSEIDGINNLAIVWYYKDDEIHIQQIYNHDTGEIYWEDNFDEVDTPSGRDWNPNDEILYCSILMWGELEQTIG